MPIPRTHDFGQCEIDRVYSNYIRVIKTDNIKVESRSSPLNQSDPEEDDGYSTDSEDDRI